jgi:3D (Asp-Asp-Asp) domain-containing protein
MRFPNFASRVIPALLLLAASCVEPQPADAYEWKELEVMVTAYNSVAWQTEGDPTIAAWGDTLLPGQPSVAVSRDLIKMGLKRDTPVLIEGFTDTFLVKDKMNARFKRHIDIFMGKDVFKAREFGRCRLKISYRVPKMNQADSQTNK